MIYITDVGEFESVCQLLQFLFRSEDGTPKAILGGGGRVKSVDHTGMAGGYPGLL
jgi:hypothetical protein